VPLGLHSHILYTPRKIKESHGERVEFLSELVENEPLKRVENIALTSWPPEAGTPLDTLACDYLRLLASACRTCRKGYESPPRCTRIQIAVEGAIRE